MNKKIMIVVIIVIVLVMVLIGGNLIKSLFTNTNKTQNATMQEESQNINNNIQQESQIQDQTQLQGKDIVVGTGDVAVAGKEITVNYTGTFSDGKVFDSSIGKAPFTFKLGAGLVIKGWDIGVEGMKVGGKRILIIPPQFGYGEQDRGPIPGNSTLIFEIELLGVK